MLLSVVIPVYNDASGVDATIQSVLKQNYSEYEIIPVDNNSTDDTLATIQRWATQYPSRVRPAVEQKIQSSYAARNTGIKASKGEVVVFIDANMTVSPDWLQRISTAFTASTVDYLGYTIEVYIPRNEHTFWGWYDTIMGLPSRYHYENKHFAPTASLAVRRHVFDIVGLFDSKAISGGDKKFGQRVYDHPDLSMDFCDDIVVFHPARTTFDAHRKKAIRIGHGLAQLYKTSDDRKKARSVLREILLHAVPPRPRRIVRRAPDVPAARLSVLYVADLVIRYVRLYGALRHLWTSSSE